MRKRSRGRTVASRGGGRGASAGSRGNRGGKSAANAKSVALSQFPLRQSPTPSTTIKFITHDPGSGSDGSSSSYLNGAHKRTLNLNGELKPKNGLAVNSFASIMETATAVIDNADFYLHKKFKKVSSTADALDTILDEVQQSNKNFGIDRKRRNGTVAAPSLPAILQASATLPLAPVHSKDGKKESTSPPINGLVNSATPTPPQSQDAGAGTSNNVYKPKFHKLLASASSEEHNRKYSFDSRLAAISEGSHPFGKIPLNRSSVSPFQQYQLSSSASSSATALQAPPANISPPGKIPGARIDRQSLDDRISQIIDQNQSILATLPEYSSRRKSHHNSGGSVSNSSLGSSATSSPRNSRSSLSSMSGSSASLDLMDQQSHNYRFNSPYDLSVRKNSMEVGSVLQSPKPKSILVRSQSDLSESLIMRNLHLMSSSPSPLSLPPVDRKESLINAQIGAGEQFAVPKKKRKLSPGVFCGGEVSEVPRLEDASRYKSGSAQDVDMTVRVSNCSGAKVTVRAQPSGGGNIGHTGASSSSNKRINLSSSSGGSVSVMGNLNPANLSRYQDHKIIMGMEQTPSFSPLISQNLMFAHDQHRFLPSTDHHQDHVMNLKIGTGSGKAPRGQTNGPKNGIINHSMRKISDVLPARSMPPIPSRKFSAMPSLPHVPIDLKIAPPKSAAPVNPKISPDSAPLPLPLFLNTPTDRDQVDRKPAAITESLSNASSSNEGNPKRPNFLPLRPINQSLKKSRFDSSLVLPSPDTPRGAKPTNQVYNNGHAYTYLGFKISTRSSYTCLFRPQPMFIPQENDPKLSMYSNWQPRPKDPNAPIHDLSTNNSGVNNKQTTITPSPPLYVVSENVGKKKGSSTAVSSSQEKQSPILSTYDSSEFKLEAITKGGSPPSSETKPADKDKDFNPKLEKSRKSSGLDEKVSFSRGDNEPGPSRKISHAASSVCSDFSGSASADDESNSSSSRIERQKKYSTESFASNQSQIDEVTRSNSPNSLLMIASRLTEQAKVRVIEGGFESNEDYTYVRGRGRGRYVCEACGIRCKKPSMLRKHLKTHTDLRPYTCKLCNFSFKTKGNLTKHQKSKSHHKKCFGLGIDPKSSQSLAMIGPMSDDDDDDSDDDDDGVDDDEEMDSNDEDNDNENGQSSSQETDNFEKEIAQSLLDLSKMTSFAGGQTQKSSSEEKRKILKSKLGTDAIDQPLSLTKPGSKEIPMDLSVKNSVDAVTKPNEAAGPATATVKFEIIPNGIVRPMGLVAEAQRWEVEEELANGCLNLTKVLNKNVVNDEVSATTMPESPASTSGTSSTQIPPVMEVKVEQVTKEDGHTPPATSVVRSPAQKIIATVRPYEFEITKRRRSSKSCSDINSGDRDSGSHPSASLTKIEPTPGISKTELPTTSAAASSALKVTKLHQPWLSPGRQTEDDDEDESSSTKRERTESFNSSTSTSESVIGFKDDFDNNNVEPSSSPSSGIDPISKTAPVKAGPGPTGIKPQAEFREPSGAQAIDGGKAECNVCGKVFGRASQLTLHMNIHYLERPFRCDPCGVSFRTKGHLIKHRRSSSHDCKVYLTEAWGVANEENPRPFKCADCKIAFRIHGHLAKHLRSKMHIMRMECLGKLPFGIYFEMEKSGMNLNEIDTTDCDMSLVSLQSLAKKIYGDSWEERLTVVPEEQAVQ